MKFNKNYLIIIFAAISVFLLPCTINAEEADKNTYARTVPHYTYSGEAGETGKGETGDFWDGEHYYLADGTLVRDAFFCDGIYTYYLQYDGTPMTDRLTYHPDGEHIIYFDKYGHEVFNDFKRVLKSISGDEVYDLCYFGAEGYMFIDRITWGPSESRYVTEASGITEDMIYKQPAYNYSHNQFFINDYGIVFENGAFQFPKENNFGFSIHGEMLYNCIWPYSTLDNVAKEGSNPEYWEYLKPSISKQYLYFDATGRYDAEISKKYDNYDITEINIINKYLNYSLWQFENMGETYTPTDIESCKIAMRVYHYALACGLSQTQAENYSLFMGDFDYTTNCSIEEYDQKAVNYYGEWVLDASLEYGLFD